MRGRLLATYLAVAVLVLALLEIPLAISYAHSERQDLAGKVERDAVALATLVEDALEQGTPVPKQVPRIAADYTTHTGGRVLVVDSSGRAIVDSAPTGSRDFSSRAEIARALAGEISSGTRSSQSLGTDLLYVAVPAASSGVVHGAVRITYPTSSVDSRIHRYWTVLAAIAAAVLAVAAATAAVLARWMVRPLDRLEQAADAIGAGDLTARATVEGPPEVRRLAETFNTMGAKVNTLVRSQDAFLADASHQLRTPLAALRLRLENLDRDVTAPANPSSTVRSPRSNGSPPLSTACSRSRARTALPQHRRRSIFRPSSRNASPPGLHSPTNATSTSKTSLTRLWLHSSPPAGSNRYSTTSSPMPSTHRATER